MTFNYELKTDLTLIMNANDEFYIKVNGIPASVIVSVKLLTAGASLVIDTCIDSFDYFLNTAQSASDLLLESIIVSGSPVVSVTSDIKSNLLGAFGAPNIIHLKNTSTSGQKIRVSLRGNRR